ncbi:MAG: hypothetical protein LBT59_09960 [Clostridiales bacterium]|nr:hypothetical protein [Clostridiales bacterium]
MKRIAALALCVFMCLSALSACAGQAATPAPDQGGQAPAQSATKAPAAEAPAAKTEIRAAWWGDTKCISQNSVLVP